MSKKIKNLIIVFILAIACFGMADFAMAQDLGEGYAENIGLADTAQSPQEIIVNIIRIALTFLSIIAVAIIMYGGWLWMTSGGEPEKINKAKKTLISAVIGLVIILSAFAIVTFIVNSMEDIIGETCTAGDTRACNGCAGPGIQTCLASETWGACSTNCGGAFPCCCSGACQTCPCGSPFAFMVTSIQPPDAPCGDTTIRNSVIRIYFNKNVDPSTVDSNSIVIQSSNTCPSVVLAPIPGDFTVNGRVVEFRASVGTCPANPCSADRCFDADSTIDIEVMTNGMNRVQTFSGELVEDSLAVDEHPQFLTNDLIDCQNPTVSLNSDPQVCLGSDNDLGFVSSDDSGVSQIEFSDNNGDAAFGGASVVIPCPGPGVCGQSPANWSLPLGATVWLPTVPAYSAGTNYTITATASDLDDNNNSDSQEFILRPDYCCNNVLDGDEEGVDCGGSCAVCSGAACGISFSETCAGDPDPNCDDNRCASGFCSCGNHPDGPLPDDSCQEKGYDAVAGNACCVCENKPVIDWVTPVGGFCDGSINTPCQDDGDCAAFAPNTCNTETPNGAVGNFVTVGGRNFGANPGTVYFSGAGGWVQAFLANDDLNGGNSSCGLDTDMWTNNQIIVVVPNGTVEGPIRVEEVVNNYTDDTDDTYGTFINDFILNTIERPGLCSLTPDHGIMNDAITYQGIRLMNSSANFGDLTGYVPALNSNFIINQQGTADVPNITNGRTSSFVFNPLVIGSNYLNFIKDSEAVIGPQIISFDPITGNVGQYVTIYGSGFGRFKGSSQVFFGDQFTGTEADYDFPDVCADSVWSDNQVIVKVPAAADGNYVVTMVIGTDVIDTAGLAVSQFNINSALPLAPSACRIQPIMGPNNSNVSLWGEYFGPQDTVRFHLNHDQAGVDILFWGLDVDADRVETIVHEDAVSGPVKIMQGVLEGNALNFTVGLCTEAPNPDDACGADICCPAGSFEEGRCHPNIDDCYPAINSSVFEWDFSTGNIPGVGTDCYDIATDIGNCNAIYPDCSAFPGLECDPNLCTCQLPNVESCMGYGAGECANNFCPNSPGNCSTYAGGGTLITGSCSDAICNGLGACATAVPPCTYDIFLNKCDNGINCDAQRIVQDALGNNVTAYCEEEAGFGRWYINTVLSCPLGWISIPGGRCVDPVTNCNYCDSGFDCLDDTIGGGVCAIDQEICPAGSTCNVFDQCEKADEAVCECCCRLANASQDCCVPLDCTGDCGSDASGPDTNTYGYCTGCADAGATQAEHDLACNCSGHTNKYCDSSNPTYPEGICRDCAQLSTSGECNLHSATCCVDAEDGNNCRGGDGTVLGGFCSYYSCNPVFPYDCLGPNINGDYEVSDCNSQCAPPPVAGGLSCFDPAVDMCDSLMCLTGYSCLGVDGCEGSPPAPPGCATGDGSCLCCCDPFNDQCGAINPDLTCTADSDPCTGNARGLCCGCEYDIACGDLANMGCGFDTCCRARPTVLSNFPLDEGNIAGGYNPNNICRNTIIRATFDQGMDTGSFSGNVIVVGDYGGDECPEGTQYLVMNEYKSKSKIAKFFNKILSFIPIVKAYVAPLPALNYCAISGTASGYNNVAGQGVMTFSPSQLLDADRRYYVIIKGDSNINDDVDAGVLSYYGIAMNGNENETFNAQTYNNSYIWAFRPSGGICDLSYIDIDPRSYLFQDVGQMQNFQAYPKGPSGQDITSIAGIYDWIWSWSSDNTGVADVTTSDNPLQTVTSQNVQDNRTLIRATATILNDSIHDPSTVGESEQGVATAYVFLCENPWPPRVAGVWTPWTDNSANCSIPEAGCPDTGYELYYCRDTGNIGTADDLPAILTDETAGNSVVRGVDFDKVCMIGNITGESCVNQSDCGVTMHCSQDATINCLNDVDCGAGNTCNPKPCQPIVLKDFYFLRESTPTSVTSLTLSAPVAGGAITADWPPVADASVVGYRLYWGTSSGNYSDYQDLGMVLTHTVGGLTNNVEYYFNLTSYYATMAESEYYGEVSETPQDTESPAVPVNLVANAGDGQIELSWDANIDDTVGYIVYYGTNTLVYGASHDVGNTTSAVITGLTGGEIYYFAVSAYDSYTNESPQSAEATAIPTP